MSHLDIKALETNFAGWKAERAPDLPVSEAFERYIVELVFKDYDLSDEEISSGLFGGGGDGGVDGAYFFINRRLIIDESDIPNQPLDANIWIIQAKNQNGFKEDSIMKMQAFMVDTLDFSKDVQSFTYYSQKVKDFISAFRSQLETVFGLLKKFSVLFVYATKSDQAPNPNVTKRVDNLKEAVQQNLTSANVDFIFWDARKILEVSRSQPVRTYALEVEQMFPYGGSFICLVRLDRFANFITDDSGQLRQHILEPNVRDYNGANNKVNGEIRATLQAGTSEEFWWLNNGITILAEECTFGVGKLQITGPELVNGLQTSHEIFRHFNTHQGEDKRTIQVRVILPPNDPVRRKIIKATNNQTPVNPLSLHANDDIHFDIEEVLRLHGIYYDRRRGEHRRKKRPVSQIVSMTDLAQVVIAVALRTPDQSRARPKKKLDTDQGYGEVFDANVSRILYVSCVLVDKIINNYLATRDDIGKDEKTDIRFYMDTWLVAKISGKATPSKSEIAALAGALKQPVPQDILDKCCAEVRALYQAHGGDDKAAKGSQMRVALLARIREEFSVAEAI